MSKADSPSIVTVGRLTEPVPSVFEYLCGRFPNISPPVWRGRIETGGVSYENGNTVRMRDCAAEGTRILYYREVENETMVPFKETILFADEHILVADKPHFLSVIPAGKYIHESLLYRLKKSTGINDLVPVHRLDRQTAGVVLFSVNRRSRDAYYDLFRKRLVHKTYKAISRENPAVTGGRWRVENRIVRGDPWFRMKCSDGDGDGDGAKAITDIVLEKHDKELCHFSMHPETGRKHQLRLHLSLIGYPVLNDRLYPELLPEEADDYTKPLQLLAEAIGFRNPLTGKMEEYRSGRRLDEDR